MRFTFSTIDSTNADVFDERGSVCYNISTPFSLNKVTTITKCGSNGVRETMGVIEWHQLRETKFRFGDKVIPANTMLEKHLSNSGRHFVGPDGKAYEWKFEPTYCWMKSTDSDDELVRFHKKSLRLSEEPHPAYLEVSPAVVPMLDHIILTFVYVESVWGKEREAARKAARRNTSTNNAAMRVLNSVLWAAQNMT